MYKYARLISILEYSLDVHEAMYTRQCTCGNVHEAWAVGTNNMRMDRSLIPTSHIAVLKFVSANYNERSALQKDEKKETEDHVGE